MEWVSFNWKELRQHDLVCTGTTGKLVDDALSQKCEEFGEVPPTVMRLKSGPLRITSYNVCYTKLLRT